MKGPPPDSLQNRREKPVMHMYAHKCTMQVANRLCEMAATSKDGDEDMVPGLQFGDAPSSTG